ncbi:MAG: hypothetical protein ACYS99_00275 [Planctomycetota bacterium]|jgi:hypothetical protein
MDPEIARAAVDEYVLPKSSVESASGETEEQPGEDSFGNPGTIRITRIHATLLDEGDLDSVSAAYEDAGFTELPKDSLTDDDRRRFRLSRLDPSDPFLWEHEVTAGIGGRELVGSQRELLARKAKALREELDSGKLEDRRRQTAQQMLDELNKGLMSRIGLTVTRRSFLVDPVFGHGGSLGEVLPMERMSQLVYRVVPRDPEHREDDHAEPMYLTVLGVDDGGATFLFSGGIVGQRTVKNLEDGAAHHAWFQNRRATEGDDTAPWVSRRVYRELANGGESRIVVRWGREDEPISVRRTGTETIPLLVDGEERQVPALVAETEKEDRLWLLEDPVSPLVLKMEETGADLLRTVDELRRLEAY